MNKLQTIKVSACNTSQECFYFICLFIHLMGSETWDTYKKGGMISFDLGINYD